ncbi:MAG: ShlB/FhaC/HecB family hemolysin secretion/activation protein, partial [Akkermansiaceae bacterium]|nr:ShlB/FhaC/HecB family hemolysin secretion/activation protein [Akkermansiaceae bacterium]
DISTSGGANVVGRGHTLGLRALFDLPSAEKFYQTFSFGIDYKNLSEDILIGKDTVASPIEYYPVSASYDASWTEEKSFTEFSTSLNFHLRGLGSDESDYSEKRFNADGSFVYLRSDLTHTHDLKCGSQLFGKIQSQISSQPLVSGEQISGGGLGTVRGYLESQSTGDNGIFSTIEYRTPSLIGSGDKNDPKSDEWRFHAFSDAGILGIYDPLPDQKKRTGLASVGVGTRFKVREHYNGSLDLGVPLVGQGGKSQAGDIRVTFRGWADF